MRAALVAVTVAFGIAAAAARAHAQPAEALGKPLPVNDLTQGTVQVKVIAGSMAKPVADVDVHIMVGIQDHTLRTNAEGHASLPDVPAGQTVKITVPGDKDKGRADVSSDAFPMPASGAVKVMLSTAPMEATPGPAAGPMANGQMDPRAASGKGRPDQSVDPGTMIATVTYDEMPFAKTFAPPVGATVVCVGYSDAHGVSAQAAKVDKEGHATFTGLDASGATSYFVMTQIARGPDPAKPIVDRLETIPPIALGAAAGWKVMLSGEKRGSDKPAVDDLKTFETKADVPAGKVLISALGVPQKGSTVTIHDAVTGKVVVTAPLVAAPTEVNKETVPLEPRADLDVGVLGVQLVRAVPPKGDGVPIAATKLAVKSGDAVVSEAKTADDGYAQLDSLPTGKPLTVEVTIAGQVERSDPFTLPDKGGAKLTLAFEWDELGHMTAMVDLPAGTTTAYYAESEQPLPSGPQTFRSEPFQPLADHGSLVSIAVYPRAYLNFHLDASAEDDYLAVRGDMTVRNYSWSPLVGGPDGLEIPLPDGFTGAGVMEDQLVAKDEQGFRVLHPIPAWGMTFHMAFSMPIHDERVDFDMPLPLGINDSLIDVRKWPPDVKVTPPTGMQGLQTGDADDHGRKYFVMQNMLLMPLVPGTVPHLRFSIDGLPSPATWKQWAPKIVGLLVIAMVLAAAGIAIGAAMRASKTRAGEAAGRRARIDALYDQLVAVEQTGAGEARREEIIAELEDLLAAERARAKAP